MRKTFLTALSLLIPMVVSAAGLQVVIDGRVVVFSDVPEEAWFTSYVRIAAEDGIVSGYKDAEGRLTGRFGPSDAVTIAQALKIAVEGAGYDEEQYARHYVSGVDHWSSSYVSVAKAMNFALFRGSIDLDRPATRAEVSKIFTDAFIIRIFPLEEGESPYVDLGYDHEYAAAVEALSENSIVSGDTDAEGNATGYFRPNATINRAEIVKMIINLRATYGSPGVGMAPTPVEEEEVDDTDDFQATVTYDATGFSPAEVRIRVGDTVRFVNLIEADLVVASDPHPSHVGLPEFDSEDFVLPGAFYQFTFESAGTFGYHNHLESSHRGTIIVEQ